jgi:hypothetical protein
MLFTREQLLDALEDAVENTIVGHSRWSVQHRAIVNIDGKFYEAEYQVGATESQDESPWQYEKTVECPEVQQVTKTIQVWERI